MKLLIFLFGFLLLTTSLLADTTNPQAKRGAYTVLSSEFGENVTEKKYPVGNAIDGNPTTAWVFEKKCSEFKDFKGLFISFGAEQEIDGVSIINGYAKSDSLYRQNNAVSEFEIILSNKLELRFKCKETLGYQDFHFQKQKVKWAIVKMVSERKGTKYDDLCISEVTPLLGSKQLLYNQSHYIINNNGGEYQSDVIVNIKKAASFDTEILDYACGARFTSQINDSTLIYSDYCEDNSIITTLYLNSFKYKTIKNKSLDNYQLVNAYSENRLILQEKEKDKFVEFNIKSKLVKTIEYNKIEKDDFWKWNYRLNKSLGKFYPALLDNSNL